MANHELESRIRQARIHRAFSELEQKASNEDNPSAGFVGMNAGIQEMPGLSPETQDSSIIFSSKDISLSSKPITLTPLMLSLQEQYGRPIQEILIDLYWVQKKSVRDVAEALKLKYPTVQGFFKKLTIPRRSQREALEDFHSDLEKKQKIAKKISEGRNKDGQSKSLKKHYDRKITKQMKTVLGKTKEEQRVMLITLHREEGSWMKVAERLTKDGTKVSVKVVRGWRKRLKITQEERLVKSGYAKINKDYQRIVQRAAAAGYLDLLSSREKGILVGRYSDTKHPVGILELAGIYNVTKQRIEQIEKKALSKIEKYSKGEEVRKRGRPRIQTDQEELKRMYQAEKLSMAEIRSKLHISITVVRKLLTDAEVPVRRGRPRKNK